MQENYFIKRQRDLRESKTGHAKKSLKESSKTFDQTALEDELRKALGNPNIEHCGDAYDKDGNDVSMFGDSTKGAAMAIARYLKSKGFAGVSIDKDENAAKDGGVAWFAVAHGNCIAEGHTRKKTTESIDQTAFAETIGYIKNDLTYTCDDIQSLVRRDTEVRNYISKLEGVLDEDDKFMLDDALARNIMSAKDCISFLNKDISRIKDIKSQMNEALDKTKKVKTLLVFPTNEESESSVVPTIEEYGGEIIEVVKEKLGTDKALCVIFYATYDEMKRICRCWDSYYQICYFDYGTCPEFFPDHDPKDDVEDPMHDPGAEFYDLWQLKKKYGIIQDSGHKPKPTESNPVTVDKVVKDTKDAYNKIWEIRTKNLKNIYDDLIMALHDEKHANMTCDAIAKLDEAM